MKPFVVCIALGLSGLAVAQRFPARPDSSYIADTAHMLTQADKTQISSDAVHLLKGHGAPIVVATIPSLAAEGASKMSVELYARRLFDHWGIGSQRHNKGILLLVSKGDRKARIELGGTWRHEFDSQCSEIMNDTILPDFRAGEASQGIASGVDALVQMTDGYSSTPTPEVQEAAAPNAYPFRPSPSSSMPFSSVPALFLVCPLIWFGFVVVIIIAAIARRGGGGPYRRTGFGQPGPFPQERNTFINQEIINTPTIIDTGGSAGGNAGGGGGGFDGGSSGGGGASGSW